jgi:hypothetical protein
MFDIQDVLILNALDKAVHTVAFGNHFNLKPGQMKMFRGEIGAFLDSNKGYMGLIAVPSELSDPEYANSEEGKALLAQKKQEGVNRHVNHLTQVVNNLQVSLRGDLESKNIKAPIETQATDGELSAMEALIHYQREQKDQSKERSEKARIRLRQIQAAQNSLVNQQKKDS